MGIGFNKWENKLYELMDEFKITKIKIIEEIEGLEFKVLEVKTDLKVVDDKVINLKLNFEKF